MCALPLNCCTAQYFDLLDDPEKLDLEALQAQLELGLSSLQWGHALVNQPLPKGGQGIFWDQNGHQVCGWVKQEQGWGEQPPVSCCPTVGRGGSGLEGWG